MSLEFVLTVEVGGTPGDIFVGVGVIGIRFHSFLLFPFQSTWYGTVILNNDSMMS